MQYVHVYSNVTVLVCVCAWYVANGIVKLNVLLAQERSKNRTVGLVEGEAQWSAMEIGAPFLSFPLPRGLKRKITPQPENR